MFGRSIDPNWAKTPKFTFDPPTSCAFYMFAVGHTAFTYRIKSHYAIRIHSLAHLKMSWPKPTHKSFGASSGHTVNSSKISISMFVYVRATMKPVAPNSIQMLYFVFACTFPYSRETLSPSSVNV